MEEQGAVKENTSEIFNRELRIKMAGFGGQGILSLGKMFADMARLRNFNVTWMPSYGPEQRGGSANCSVILSRGRIPSPMISRDCDLMITMTQTALDKFGKELKKDGILIYDSSTMKKPDVEAAVIFGIDALEIASSKVGNNKCANSVLLGALAVILEKKGYLVGGDVADYDKVFEEAIRECFSKKPQVIDANIAAYKEGKKAAAESL